MDDVHDWAEVHRLHREGHSNSAIARRLGMSRTTVIRPLRLGGPPAYRRTPKGSIPDPFKDRIPGMLLDDPAVPATVILRELRRAGYGGGIAILKEHLAGVRPVFRRALAHQRRTYLPGEVAQGDWWHTGLRIPVGKGAVREAFAWVTTSPRSAAHAAVFCSSRTTRDLLPAILGCILRLGGVPEALVVDNDPSIVAPRRGRRVVLREEVVPSAGHLGIEVVAPPRGPPNGRAGSSGPSATRRPRSRRPGGSRTSRTCRASTTAAPRRWPPAGGRGGSPGPWPRPWPWSGASSGRSPTPRPTSPAAPRPGSRRTGSSGWRTSTTRCPRSSPGASSGCGSPPRRSSSPSMGTRWPGTRGATSPPTSSPPRPTRGPSAWPGKRGPGSPGGDVEVGAVDLARYDRLLGVGG